MGCASSDEGASGASTTLAQQASVIDAGKAPAADAGSAAAKGPLSGSAAANSCSYFSKPDAGANTCTGYYCGVTEAQIAAAMPVDSVCGNPKGTCTGELTDKLTTCVRNVVIANLGQPGASLRGKIEDCMYADADTKANVKPGCLGCFIDSSICIVDNCLMECSSDGPGCETCRKEKNCVQDVFSCGGLPSPL